MNIKLRLIIMNFLEFAVWGAYLTSMGGYLARIGLGDRIWLFFAMQGVVSIFMPALVGMIADKWIPAQRMLSYCHALAGAFMLGVAVYAHGLGSDVDFGIFDIGPSVEHDTLVALACAKEVTGDRVLLNVLKRTRHADGATRHIDGACAHHVGLLVAAIDVGEDMATGDVDHGIAPHTPCRAAPNRLGIIFVPERIIT